MYVWVCDSFLYSYILCEYLKQLTGKGNAWLNFELINLITNEADQCTHGQHSTYVLYICTYVLYTPAYISTYIGVHIQLTLVSKSRKFPFCRIPLKGEPCHKMLEIFWTTQSHLHTYINNIHICIFIRSGIICRISISA